MRNLNSKWGSRIRSRITNLIHLPRGNHSIKTATQKKLAFLRHVVNVGRARRQPCNTCVGMRVGTMDQFPYFEVFK